MIFHVSRMFHGNFKDVSCVLHGCLTYFNGCFMVVLLMFQASFEEVAGIVQQYLKGIKKTLSKVF